MIAEKLLLSGATFEYGAPIPAEFQGRWRGFNVKEYVNGVFIPGEYDLVFGADTIAGFDEYNHEDYKFKASFKDNAFIIEDGLETLPLMLHKFDNVNMHTTEAYALIAPGAFGMMPSSLSDAMKDMTSKVSVMYKCKSNTSCDFSNVDVPHFDNEDELTDEAEGMRTELFSKKSVIQRSLLIDKAH